MATCRVCKCSFRYGPDAGYDRHVCGQMCDGIEAGRLTVIAAMRQLAGQFRVKADENVGTDAELAFECCASSVERVCIELECK